MARSNKTVDEATVTPDEAVTPVEETAPVVDDPQADWVEVYVPKEGVNGEPNKFVRLNERTWLIPRGVPTKAPPEVAASLERSRKAQMLMDMRIDKLTAQAAQQP